jgi:hypothetical protein
MKTLLRTMKTYGTAIVGAVISVLLIVVRVLTKKNSRLRRQAETAEARVSHAQAVMKADKEIEEQADVHLAEVAKEIEDGKPPGELTNPNDGWLHDD